MAVTSRAPEVAPPGDLRAPLGAFRITVLGVCALLTVPPPHHAEALYVLLAQAIGELLAYHFARFARPWPYLGAVTTAGAVPWTGAGSSPLLPYLLAAGLAAGLLHGRRELLLVTGLAAGTLLLGGLLPGTDSEGSFLVVGTQWVLLSLALGLVAIWARRLTLPPPDATDDYRRVRDLLEQLRGLTRHLPGGLDASSAAEALLDRCGRLLPHSRSAVVVQPTGGAFVPLAVRGARRVPWRAPLDQDGPLRTAWETGQPVQDRRAADRVGRRRGSTLLAVPLLTEGRPFGLVIWESYELDAFSPTVVEQLRSLVGEASAQLETALLFEELRLQASAEERDRLAREMHDGIAQELAFIGYRLDELRLQAAAVDPTLAAAVSTLRGDLTALMSDIRLSITDLRTTVRPDRGLGAALSTYLHAVCSGKDVVLNVSLQETAFRLPAEHEITLFKAAQAFAQEVRRSTTVTTLSVRLHVDPPSAQLQLSCDGSDTEVDLGDIGAALARLGANVTTSTDTQGSTSLDIELRGGPDGDQRPAGRRSRADKARPAPRVRAD